MPTRESSTSLPLAVEGLGELKKEGAHQCARKKREGDGLSKGGDGGWIGAYRVMAVVMYVYIVV